MFPRFNGNGANDVLGASNSFLGYFIPLLSQLVFGCQHVNSMPFGFVIREVEAVSHVQESQEMMTCMVCSLLVTSLGCSRAKDLDLSPLVNYLVML